MVPFKPYFLGEEPAPWPSATTVQKCVRVDGKDNDLEEVGRDGSHLSFFEMLGNFSFGDYFKAEAIPMAWDMVTDLFGIDPDQLWVTVHTDDDEAAQLWVEAVGRGPRARPAPATDNWWGPPGGPPGPCGPNSEIFVDLGERYGDGRRSGPRQRGPVPRDLEPRVHAVQPRPRRRRPRPAPQEHRHRRRARAHPRRAAGQGQRLGHRRHGAADRDGAVGDRAPPAASPTPRTSRCASWPSTPAR